MVSKSVQLDKDRELYIGDGYGPEDVLKKTRPHLIRILHWYEAMSDYACKTDNELADYDARDVRGILGYIDRVCGK